MRVISGKFRGRRLLSPRGMEIRPTSDRLKQTLFDILATRIGGAVFLDGFAGTGSVGIEALSRGAKEVVYIESSPEAVKLVRRNLEVCGVVSGYRIVPRDVFTALRDLGRQDFRPDIVFFDPPYHWEPYRDLLNLLFNTGMAGPGTVVAIEHHAKADVPDAGEEFMRSRIVAQGDKRLTFYSKKPQPESRNAGGGT